jgi:hypothetical protein
LVKALREVSVGGEGMTGWERGVVWAGAEEIARLRAALAEAQERLALEVLERNIAEARATANRAEAAEVRAQLGEAQRERDELLAYWKGREAMDARRCGTCADYAVIPPSGGLCYSKTSACRLRDHAWPADHGCPHWRAKEAQ